MIKTLDISIKTKDKSNVLYLKSCDLKEGQRVSIADTLMQFYYWQGDTPVFTYNAEDIQINYINHDFNRETVFELK